MKDAIILITITVACLAFASVVPRENRKGETSVRTNGPPAPLVAQTVEVAALNCESPKYKGHVCSRTSKITPSIGYYYDKELGMCLAFKYNGCGGNGNRYQSQSECEWSCIPQDYGWCSLSKEAYKNEDGETRICASSHDPTKNEKCPSDYNCKMLAFFAICCPKKSEDLFVKNYKAQCPNNGTVLKVDRGGYKSPVFGKSCQDDFCPSNATCEENELLSICCT